MANDPEKFEELLKEINNGIFSAQTLDLSNQGLDDADFAALMSALEGRKDIKNSIKKLDLGFNKISVASFHQFESLESLDLYGNQLAINPVINNCPKLRMLNIEGNGMKEYNPYSFEINNLKAISGNKLNAETIETLKASTIDKLKKSPKEDWATALNAAIQSKKETALPSNPGTSTAAKNQPTSSSN